jgi:hypothetical protein
LPATQFVKRQAAGVGECARKTRPLRGSLIANWALQNANCKLGLANGRISRACRRTESRRRIARRYTCRLFFLLLSPKPIAANLSPLFVSPQGSK